MNETAIVRMWGYADAYELIFKRNESGAWTASVPPDMEDGQYAAEIHGEDETGRVCLWTGILYMNQGKHCLVINERKYSFWLKPRQISLDYDSNGFEISFYRIATEIKPLPQKYTIQLRRCRKA